MKTLVNAILLIAIGFGFGSGTVQLAVAKYLGDIKTIDYVVVGGNKVEYVPVDRNVLLYRTSSTNSGTGSNTSNSTGSIDLGALLGDAEAGVLGTVPNEYSGGEYINRLSRLGAEEGHASTITVFGKTYPVLNSIGKNLKTNQIGRFYFNSDIYALDAEKTKNAFALYAHSYFGKGGAEVGEQVIKMGVGNWFKLDSETIDIIDTVEFLDTDEREGLATALEKYWNSKADIIVYTCKRINGKDGKYFVIGKRRGLEHQTTAMNSNTNN